MEQQPTTARAALKWGAISGIGSMIFTTIMYVTGQVANGGLAWLGMTIPIAAMVMAMKEFRTQNGGFMSYGQGLGIGTLLSGIGGFLAGVYNYIYNEFVDPTLRQQILDKTREELENRGIDDAQIDATIEMSAKFSTPGITFALSIFMAILIGFIFSLIVSAIMKKDKPFDFE
ncbi:MAG: DUF4199 domain-containing protein [Bacteroidetes bacterium]|nr:DUF4199 domain-containing protein [Bacteroidota bacterium]